MTQLEALMKFDDFMEGMRKRIQVVDGANEYGANCSRPNVVKEFREFIKELFPVNEESKGELQ